MHVIGATFPVIASVAKQSILQWKEGMDCFVANAPRKDSVALIALSLRSS